MHRIVPTLLVFILLIAPTMLQASITGTVFKDADADGIADTGEVGLPGIVISAFDSGGTMVSQTASCGTFPVSIAANPPSIPVAINIPACALANIGQYTLNGLTAATQYRLETTLLDPLLFSSANGVDAVRFATDGDTNVRFGVNYPEDYCQNNPRIIAGCYVIDLTQPTLAAPYDPASTEPLIASWPYNTRFTTAANAEVHTGSYTNDADYGDLGHVFGVAIHRPTLQAFFSGIASPQWDFGSGGIGAIYTADYSGPGDTFVPASTSVFVDLAPLTDLTNQTPVTMGVLDRFGEQGLGGIEISDDGTTMWAINMGAGSLLEIDIGNPAVAPIAADVNEITITGASCVNGTFRPSAVALHRGNVFVGGICDASGGTVANLAAVVLEYDGTTFTNRMTETLDFNVNQIFPNPSFQMAPWSNANSATAPQPVMTDLVFDDNEGIIIGLMPRVVYNFFAQTAGIILRADPDGMGNFILENGGSSGPYSSTADTAWAGAGFTSANPEPLTEGPGGDYFFENGIFSGAFQAPPFSPPSSATYHPVLFSAGITVVPGTGEVAAGYTDPLSINAFGVRYMDRTNGQTVGGLQFGGLKVALVSDVSAICHSAPLEIGNRLWCDADANGIQDPGEAGANGVAVRLQCGLDNPVTVTTSGDGNYAFTDALYAAANGGDNIPRGASCSVLIDTTGVNGTAIDNACSGVGLSPINNGGADAGADLRDSDGTLMGNDVVIPVTTGGSGNNNYALDQGFIAAPAVMDFGDAPDTYGTTLAASGPNHTIVSGFSLGATVDDEADGQPGAGANLDGADEDGVVIVGGMPVACTTNNALTVTLTNTAGEATPQLDGWIDFNGDGDFDNAEHLFSGVSAALSSGVNNLTFDVPCDAVVQSVSYARFRLSSAGALTPLGAAANGEVEDYTVQIKGIDLGDAPNTYGTNVASSGAQHAVSALAPLHLGACVDTETDGQANASASGDDNGAGISTVGTCVVAGDDEDGVVFNDMIIACGMSSVTVTAGQAGVLNAWIDFNADGDFDAADQVFTDQALAAGANALSITVPCNAIPQNTSYARFRFDSAGGLGPTGSAADGEVEDYQVSIKGLDLGDAPDSYDTLIASDGPRHVVDSASTLFMGTCVDTENDGQPSMASNGDDLGAGNSTVGVCATANDDEDGITFNNMLVACEIASIDIRAPQAGLINAWIDFNADGDFDAAEQIFTDQNIFAGFNTLQTIVPCDAVAQVNAQTRFRISSAGGDGPTGLAMDGEVEDHQVTVKGLDLGDAPDSYSTLMAASGAQHVVDPATPLYLGACVDNEADGQPNASANGDDNGAGLGTVGTCAIANDDEDGVVFTDPLVVCDSGNITVTAGQAGLLDGWIDFNGDGDFGEAADQIFSSEALVAGANVLNVNVPCAALPQASSYARFRFSSAGGLGATGNAMDGEIEDYNVVINEPILLDFGDAPDTYGTTLAASGANHVIVAGFSLGATIDDELDGQPSATATGDTPDEDGVVIVGGMPVACSSANALTVSLTNTAGEATPRLDAWIDFNGDGDFDANEHLFAGTSAALSDGVNNLTYDVPCDAVPQSASYARFRLSSAGSLPPTGNAANGEVEDYRLIIKGLDLGDAPDSYGTLFAADGARHIINIGNGVYLGACVDTEADGQPVATADGDDLGVGLGTAGICAVVDDDEDGVVFNDMFVACGSSDITVTATSAAVLNAWIDFNGDGDFDVTDQISNNQALVAGANVLSINVPCDAVPQANSYARFRVSTAGNDGPTGEAMDGEIEDYRVVIKGLDLGDVPDTYGTTIAAIGARHVVDPTTPLYLGACVDSEAEGQPTTAADGDDIAVGLGTLGSCATANDDEDGVVFNDLLEVCGTSNITVTAGQAGILDAWIDFNGDGDFDVTDNIANGVALVAGANAIAVNVPCDAVIQAQSYARFRFSDTGITSPTDIAMTGEVEDYSVSIAVLSDLGDAPDSYGTTVLSGGAQHIVNPAIPLYFGACVDTEADGQPTINADGDDLGAGIGTSGACASINEDEDGVTFDDMIIACDTANITVTASQTGLLNAWIDFNGDGDFDVADQIATNVPLVAGANPISVNVPCDAVPQSTSYARFRISQAGNDGPTGLAQTGEIEDYAVIVKGLDLGDLPDSYGTTVLSSGAQHVVDPITPLYLGACVDTEADGQPNNLANGDDLGVGLGAVGTCAAINDEDGVVFTDALETCNTANVAVTAGQAGQLDAWIDFNGDGDFDATDQVANNLVLTGGVNMVAVNVPCDAVAQSRSYARFRFSSTGGLSATGAAVDGEVEDYTVSIAVLSDFGDAPDSYGTILASDGARHVVVPGFSLGATEDDELDGQPSLNADGDGADEDGVVIAGGRPVACSSANGLTVNLINTAGEPTPLLDGWIDFNGNGSFDVNEHLFGGTSTALTVGANALSYDVPCDAVPQALSYARFRLSSSGSLSPTGQASNGEIEDYTLEILGSDFGDLPDTFGTTIGAGGAQHVIDPTIPTFLGMCVDSEADGAPSNGADGDDIDTGSSSLGTCAGNNDEDGVSFTTPILEDSVNTGVIVDLPVGAGAQACFLNVWFDFNHSGVFNDGPGEQVITDQLLAAGSGQNALSIVIPDNITPGDTYVRFRCDSIGGLGPVGPADDGEVEDYVVTVGQNANLALIKEVDSPSIEQGEIFNYTLTVTNNGPGDAVNVTVTDQLPAELIFVSTTGCLEDPVAMPLCSLGDLANGESVSYTIAAQLSPMALGNIVNTAVADSDTSDPDESDNTEGATIGVVILIPSLNLWGIISLMALLLLIVRLTRTKMSHLRQ